MKKLIISMLLIVVMLLTCSCFPSGLANLGNLMGGGEEAETTPSSPFGGFDIGALLGQEIEEDMGNATDVVFDDLSEAEKQALIDEAKQDGVDISFTPDGKMVATDEDGTVMVQNPDGTWSVQNEDGSVGQIGGEWPSNEFTKLIPKPDFELFAANESETEFSVSFASVSIEQIREYAEKVKAAGFTVDAVTEDQAMMGIVIYSYSASNSAGYSVEIFSAMGMSGLTITKSN